MLSSRYCANGLQSAKQHSDLNRPIIAVHLCSLHADVLLPNIGLNAQSAFAAYLSALKHSHVFDDKDHDLSQLQNEKVSRGGSVLHDRTKPVIGVLSSEPHHLLPARRNSLIPVLRRIQAMGCRAVVLPPVADVMTQWTPNGRDAIIRNLTGCLDGLVGLGGADLHPYFYGQRHRYAVDTNYKRDRFEYDVVKSAMQNDVFMFGICRSHQLWNVVRGGVLYQDVVATGLASCSRNQRDFGCKRHSPFRLYDAEGRLIFEHRIDLKRGSALSLSARGVRRLLTNGMYHQAVKIPGRNMQITATVYDPITMRHTIAATETWKMVTTQWHPELLLQSSAQRDILSLLGRRSWMFYLSKQLRRWHIPVNIASLESVMALQPVSRFTAADHAWVAEQFVPHWQRQHELNTCIPIRQYNMLTNTIDVRDGSYGY